MNETELLTSLGGDLGGLALVAIIIWRMLSALKLKVEAMDKSVCEAANEVKSLKSKLDECEKGLSDVRNGQHRLELRQIALESQFGVRYEISETPTEPMN